MPIRNEKTPSTQKEKFYTKKNSILHVVGIFLKYQDVCHPLLDKLTGRFEIQITFTESVHSVAYLDSIFYFLA